MTSLVLTRRIAPPQHTTRMGWNALHRLLFVLRAQASCSPAFNRLHRGYPVASTVPPHTPLGMMTKFVADLDDEALQFLVEALTESGQAISIFDADDNLRYANKTYEGMFLGD